MEIHGVAGNECKQLKKKYWELLEWLKMSGVGWILLKSLEITRMAGNGQNLPEIANKLWTGWKWLE